MMMEDDVDVDVDDDTRWAWGGPWNLFIHFNSRFFFFFFLYLPHSSPVWFGCDVGKQFKNDLGFWHERLFDMDGFFDAQISGLTKKERLQYGQTLMTHAMTFTGLTRRDGDGSGVERIETLKVANSWGDAKVGKKGFQTMSVGWFHEHVFEIAAPRDVVELVCPGLGAVLDSEDVTELPPWDPMGALARETAARD
jgi:bleomycin hydrolase